MDRRQAAALDRYIEGGGNPMGDDDDVPDDAVQLVVSLAPGATAFRLDGQGDGGRIALDFDRTQVGAALAVYSLIAPTDGEDRLVRVRFELA